MDIHHQLEQLWDQCFAADKVSSCDVTWPAGRILAERLLAGAEADWTTGVSHIHAGEVLRAKGRGSDALAEYALAFAHTAPSTNLLLYVVIGFAAMQDLPAAEAWGYRLIEHGGDNADIYLHLSIAVWNSGRRDEALALCDLNVARHPKHVGAVATAAGFYMATARSSKALDVCLSLLALDADAFMSTPYFYKIVVSAAISSDQQLPASYLAKIEAAAADPAGPIEARDALAMLELREATRVAWRDFFTSDRPPAPETVDTLAKVPRSRLEQFFSDYPSPQFVSLADAAALTRLYPDGLPLADTLTAAGFKAEGVLRDPTLAGREHSEFLDTVIRLQHTIISEGQVSLLSPFGDRVTSASSFVAAYRPIKRENGNVIFYFFAEPRPLFVVLANETIWPLAWYDPITEVVLMHEAVFDEGFKAYIRQGVSDLRHILLHDVVAAKSYLAGDRNRRGKPVTLLFGVLAYLSTHLLDIQGLARLCDGRLIEHVSTIVLTAPEPLGMIEDYFPQVCAETVQRPTLDDLIDLNTYLWRGDAMSIRATGCEVGDRVAAAVLAHAVLRADRAWKQEVDEVVAQSDLVLFVALRAVSRKWLAVPGEIAGMFNALRTDFPRLTLMFDGYSKTPDDPIDTNSAVDLQYIAPILEHLSASIRVMTVAGRTMNDAIYAAQAADMHLSAQGTSATKGLLIASKPGVTFGPRQFTIDFASVRTPRPATIVLREQSVDMLDGNCQTNFSLDPDIVLAGLRQIASKISRRGTV